MQLSVLSIDALGNIVSRLYYVDAMAFRWTCKLFVGIKQASFTKIFRQRLYPIIQLDPEPNIEAIYKNEDALIDDMELLDTELSNGPVDEKTDDYLRIGKKMQQIRSSFCEVVKNTKSIISGSFILDCLYNTNYHNNINTEPLVRPGLKPGYMFTLKLTEILTFLI
jgi:hypothetical protein